MENIKIQNSELSWLNKQHEENAKNDFPVLKFLFLVLFGVVFIFSAFILVDGINLALANGGFSKMNFVEGFCFKLLGLKGILFSFLGLGTLSLVFALRLVFKYFK